MTLRTTMAYEWQEEFSESVLTFVQQVSVVLVTVKLTFTSECMWVGIAL